MAKIDSQIYKNAYKWQFEAYPFYTSVYNKAAGRPVRKYFTSFDQFLNYFHDGQLYAFVPRTRINRIGNRVIKELIGGNGVFIVHFEKVHNEMREAIRLCLKARESGDYADLQKWWPATQKALSDVSSILFNFDFTLDNFLLKLRKESESDFNLLRQSIYTDIPSFINEAQKELLKLNKKYSGDIKKIKPEFIEKFGWFQNSYKEKFTIDEKWLKKYMGEIKNEKSAVIFKKCVRSAKFGMLPNAARIGITFRDDKKKLLLIAVDLMEPWLKGVCKKNGWQYEEMRWLAMDEILLMLAGKHRSYYLAKARTCALSDCRYGMMVPFGYSDIAPDFWRKVFALNSPGIASGEIKGVPANKGKLRGVVKVIINPKAAGHFQDGDILVTSMTRPEFFALMKKASAFITDEGGITCHAAIVAREMGKPCIIGTKIATKVLKDGDMVEVDAERGVVKILN